MQFSQLEVNARTVSFKVHGTGCETPQVYISYPNSSHDPKIPTKVLRYFKKICSPAGTVSVSYTLTDRDVSNWDVETKQWVVTKGVYGITVGSSSEDPAALVGHATIN